MQKILARHFQFSVLRQQDIVASRYFLALCLVVVQPCSSCALSCRSTGCALKWQGEGHGLRPGHADLALLLSESAAKAKVKFQVISWTLMSISYPAPLLTPSLHPFGVHGFLQKLCTGHLAIPGLGRASSLKGLSSPCLPAAKGHVSESNKNAFKTDRCQTTRQSHPLLRLSSTSSWLASILCLRHEASAQFLFLELSRTAWSAKHHVLNHSLWHQSPFGILLKNPRKNNTASCSHGTERTEPHERDALAVSRRHVHQNAHKASPCPSTYWNPILGQSLHSCNRAARALSPWVPPAVP